MDIDDIKFPEQTPENIKTLTHYIIQEINNHNPNIPKGKITSITITLMNGAKTKTIMKYSIQKNIGQNTYYILSNNPEYTNILNDISLSKDTTIKVHLGTSGFIHRYLKNIFNIKNYMSNVSEFDDTTIKLLNCLFNTNDCVKSYYYY